MTQAGPAWVTRFQAAASEAALSRIFAGQHTMMEVATLVPSNPRGEGTLTIVRQVLLLSRPELTNDPPSRFNGQRDTAVTSAGNPDH